MQMKHMPAFLTLMIMLSLVVLAGHSAAVTLVADSFTPNVQCAGGLMGRGKCPQGHELESSGLLTLSDLNYAGAFRVNGNTFGSSSVEYTNKHILAINSTTNNLLMTGASTENARDVGEFEIPALSTSETLADLSIASNTQPFVDLFDQIPTRTIDADEGNGIGIYGMYEYNNNIIVNYAVYYDAGGPFADETTFVKRNSTDIDASAVDVGGAYKLQGAALASGWISPIPAAWQAALGGDHISGFSAGTTRAILSRLSMGPSAYVFDIDDLINGPPANGATISTTAAMSFPYPNGLGIANTGDVDNELLTPGEIWNNATEANYCFIVPNSDTYLCVGHQAGFTSGLDYKVRNDTSQTDWGDYDAVSANDYRNIYMMFDVNDLVSAKNGSIATYDIEPYEWGTFSPVYGGDSATGINQISGATFDPETGRLYVAIANGDPDQMVYSNQPVIAVYTFN